MVSSPGAECPRARAYNRAISREDAQPPARSTPDPVPSARGWYSEHMTQQTEPGYDVIVLGAGPVGENIADRAVRGGLTAALVEYELVGGECSYWACMPSKALLRPAEAVRAARAVGGAAGAVTGPLDVPAVLARRDAFTHDYSDDGQAAWVADA